MAYLKWIIKSFQRNLAYRLEYYMSLLNAFLYIVIFTSVWAAIFAEGKNKDGLTREIMVQYAIYATLIKVSVSRARDLIGEKVRSGDIAVELMKPVSLPMIAMADALGSSMFQLFSRVTPLLVLSFFIFDLNMPKGLDLGFFASYALSFLTFYGLMFTISVSSFFLLDNFGIWILNSALISVLSGAIIPINILPDFAKDIAYMTPYPYLFYLPTMKLIQNTFPFDGALMKQAMAATATVGFSLFLFKVARRKVYIQGG